MGWIEAREALVDARTKLVELTRQFGFQRLDLMSIDDIEGLCRLASRMELNCVIP
jgi:cystathionine beta-lyase family protein involved in aluminum resistance